MPTRYLRSCLLELTTLPLLLPPPSFVEAVVSSFLPTLSSSLPLSLNSLFFKHLFAFHPSSRIYIPSLRFLPLAFIWTFGYCTDDRFCIGSFHLFFHRTSARDDDLEHSSESHQSHIICDW
ncbi:unnamed protein product [Taenia asiatica]|uniref:Secreted protein n=1 Tax=Taenia asiatica TaxID=60517 RepID=A0A0R3VUU9_TAEAS|nr:unnamed protein product [Taenia asiatica]